MKASLVRRFRKILDPKRCLHTPEDLYAYSHDVFARGNPELVLIPHSTEEVSKIMRIANDKGIPVTARGGASSLSGMTTPVKGGIVLAMNQMNHIIEINKEDRLTILEPGVVTSDLHKAAEKVGMFYPPDPASSAMSLIGGNVATNAGGPRCLKYGVTRDYIMALEVVMADGDVLRTGSRAVKDVTGYDLTHLICGSEGTLGVITKITAKLIPKPETKKTLITTFDTLEGASNMVSSIIGSGIVPTTLEIMDQAYLQAVEDLTHIGLPVEAAALLLIEVDGFSESVERQANTIQQFCREQGAMDTIVARNQQESDELWRGRRYGSVALMRNTPRMLTHDATVPVSKIPALVSYTHKIANEYGIKMVVLGHAGDGNMHPNFLLQSKDDPEEMERFHKVSYELFRFTVECGGTLSGEHGIGLEKNPYLNLQVDDVGMKAMRAIKQAWDPKGILNPGKFL